MPTHEGPCQKPDLGEQSHIQTEKFIKVEKPVVYAERKEEKREERKEVTVAVQ